MKQYLKPAILPCFILIAGALGLLLRFWQLSSGTDGKGLPISGHPAEPLLLLLTAGVLVILIWLTRNLVLAPKYSYNYPPYPAGSVGAWLGAAGILWSSLASFSGGDALQILTSLLGILSGFAVLFIGLCRWKGLPLSVIFHSLVCVYMMLHLICLYRKWCSVPQLQDYLFQLLAVVCLMLSLFHRAAFDVELGKRRPLALFHLAAVFFCLLAIPGSGNSLFFLGTAAWMLTDLCNLTPIRRPLRQKG